MSCATHRLDGGAGMTVRLIKAGGEVLDTLRRG
jgi:hypothetical protein